MSTPRATQDIRRAGDRWASLPMRIASPESEPVAWGEVRSCIGKAVFASKRDAKTFVKQRGYTQKPYRCDYCGAFHLASKGRT